MMRPFGRNSRTWRIARAAAIGVTSIQESPEAGPSRSHFNLGAAR
jgi:hypothetical protein